jgi:multidrug efflux pump subunit AcrA (membrane-fusion protein)
MIRTYGLFVVAMAGIALAIAMVVTGNRTPPVSPPAVAPANAPFASYIFGPGLIEASTENIAIGTPVPGIVTGIYVKWGDRVKAGTPLFRIDTRDLDAQLPAAVAKVNEVRATLEKAKNRLRVGEHLDPGVSISVEELANRRYDVSTNDAILASADAQVKQIRTEIERRTIRALTPGRILQIKIRPGEFAQSGTLSTPLMLLGDDTQLHVRVDIDETDAWRFQPCASAVASVRGSPDLTTSVQFVRTEPNVIPKVLLTGDPTQRTDARVLQVIYGFSHAALPVYVGQQMDVFIEAPPVGGAASRPPRAQRACGDDTTHSAQTPPDGGRSR